MKSFPTTFSISFWILLVLPTSALAQAETRGLSQLAILSSHVDCEQVLSTFSGAKKLGIVYLDKTFGEDTSCLQRLLNDPRPAVINQTITNSPGRRNRRLQSHEYLPKTDIKSFCRGLEDWDPGIIQGVQRAASEAYGRIRDVLQARHELWITPDLESSCSSKAQEQFIQAIRPIYDRPVKFVSYGSLVAGADLWEANHSSNPDCRDRQDCIKNNDGSIVNDWDAFFAGKSAAKWAWMPSSNCLPSSTRWTPPTVRTNCWSEVDRKKISPYLSE